MTTGSITWKASLRYGAAVPQIKALIRVRCSLPTMTCLERHLCAACRRSVVIARRGRLPHAPCPGILGLPCYVPGTCTRHWFPALRLTHLDWTLHDPSSCPAPGQGTAQVALGQSQVHTQGLQLLSQAVSRSPFSWGIWLLAETSRGTVQRGHLPLPSSVSPSRPGCPTLCPVWRQRTHMPVGPCTSATQHCPEGVG